MRHRARTRSSCLEPLGEGKIMRIIDVTTKNRQIYVHVSSSQSIQSLKSKLNKPRFVVLGTMLSTTRTQVGLYQNLSLNFLHTQCFLHITNTSKLLLIPVTEAPNAMYNEKWDCRDQTLPLEKPDQALLKRQKCTSLSLATELRNKPWNFKWIALKHFPPHR